MGMSEIVEQIANNKNWIELHILWNDRTKTIIKREELEKLKSGINPILEIIKRKKRQPKP